jgi:hypothetical protein
MTAGTSVERILTCYDLFSHSFCLLHRQYMTVLIHVGHLVQVDGLAIRQEIYAPRTIEEGVDENCAVGVEPIPRNDLVVFKLFGVALVGSYAGS